MVITDVPVYTIRPVRPADADPLREMLESLSLRTRWLRYRSCGPADLALRESDRISRPDPERQLILLAEDPAGTILAVGEWFRDRTDPGLAEVAVLVRDNWQGRGLGSVIGRALLTRARRAGIRTLRADVAAENMAVRRLLERSRLVVTIRFALGEFDVQIHLDRPAATV